MTLFIFIVAIAVAILIRLMVTIRRTKDGKEEKVREYYAFKCVALLIALAGDVIAALVAPFSFWDLLAGILQVETKEPLIVSIISKLLVAVVFVFSWMMVEKNYAKWSGPVSRRQHRLNTQELEDSNIVKDFWLVVVHCFRRNPDLKIYRRFDEAEEYYKYAATEQLAWHIEFAKMYMLLSNQAHIDVENDWHQQEHCFISAYADKHKVAIYCASNIPSADTVRAFLEYIHWMNSDYLHIVIAVKEGEQGDYQETCCGKNVEYMFKCNALDKLVDFTDYFKAIGRLYQQPIMGSRTKIEDIFVEPRCKEEKSGEQFALGSYVNRWLKEPGNRQLALLGDFGQGKTLFSIHLAHEMIRNQRKRIPILIPLRNKSPRNSNQAEILSYFGAQYGISAEALMILNGNGRLLLIFDGFDEMDLVGNDDIRKLHFKSLWSLVTPQSKLLITGRPNYFLSPEEMKSALGLSPGTKELPYCEGLSLMLFDREQIMCALRNAGETVRRGIQYILDHKASESFLDLVSRPSHLFFASLIWEERELEKKYDNLSSAIIINEFLQYCFERQTAKGEQNPYFYLSPVEREYFMIGIAVKMYKLGATSISQETFKDTIVDLVDMFPGRLSAENSVFLNLRNGKSVKNFAQEDVNAMLAIINDVRTCGILVNDYVNNGLTFAHKSFFDLLVAKFYLGKTLQLHDANMLISKTLETVSAFRPRLKGDYVVRKLLAELICEKISLRFDGTNEKMRCIKIFEQCRKTILRLHVSTTPQKLLQICLKKEKDIQELEIGKRKRHKEVRNLIVVLVMILFALVLYLVKVVRLAEQCGEEALRLYEGISLPIEGSGALHPLLELLAALGWPCAILLGGAFAVYFLGSVLDNASRDRADMVLFTWYHACVEHHISEATIRRQFPRRYADAFFDYVHGKNVSEVQQKLGREAKKKRWHKDNRSI